MIINNEIIIASYLCIYKAFLLLEQNSNRIYHDLFRVNQEKIVFSQNIYLQNFQISGSNLLLNKKIIKANSVIVNSIFEFENLKANCPLFINDGINNQITLFSGTNNVLPVHKIELFFISYVLSKIGIKVDVAQVITADLKKHSIKITNYSNIIKLINKISELINPPLLILKSTCSMCEFKHHCLKIAKNEDNLSLLDSISTEVQIRKYEKKGIFTIKQLSYTYKPRRIKKRAKNKTIVFRCDLQSLALRTNKIYIEEIPNFTRSTDNIEIFIDIEGIPEKHLFYLFGLLVKTNQTIQNFSYWVSNQNDEKDQCLAFVEKLNSFPNYKIYHYGNYENKALKVLSNRYQVNIDSIINRLENVNTYIFGKIYFPTYSNSLKDIGNFIGASWSINESSGLQSIFWRCCWENTLDDYYKNILINYNTEDCIALKLLVENLSNIEKRLDIVTNIRDELRSDRCPRKSKNKLHQRLIEILSFSETTEHYRSKLFFKDENSESKSSPKELKKRLEKIPKKLRPTKIIKIRRRVKCPLCGLKPLKESKTTTEKITVDLKFTQKTVVKEIRKYWANRSYCKNCKKDFTPAYFNIHGHPGIYGRNIKIWVCYLRIVLRNPYSLIRKISSDLFKLNLADSIIIRFIEEVGAYYLKTENMLISRILKSKFIHIDETTINIKGRIQYVWVLRNADSVYLKHTETRENEFIKILLKNYKGIIITDFYSGYDSINCIQQKCWVHLIREINNNLWQNPFDKEFQLFVESLRDLLLPIMITIQKYGLRKRHFNKHKKSVEQYFRKWIFNKHYNSLLCINYQKRLQKNKEELFTFLNHDDILWHNNPAEIVVRHLKLQGDISRSYSETTTVQYLRLLSIMQTCKFQQKSFLHFLLSGKQDINDFHNTDGPLMNARPYNSRFDINLIH